MAEKHCVGCSYNDRRQLQQDRKGSIHFYST